MLGEELQKYFSIVSNIFLFRILSCAEWTGLRTSLLPPSSPQTTPQTDSNCGSKITNSPRKKSMFCPELASQCRFLPSALRTGVTFWPVIRGSRSSSGKDKQCLEVVETFCWHKTMSSLSLFRIWLKSWLCI